MYVWNNFTFRIYFCEHSPNIETFLILHCRFHSNFLKHETTKKAFLIQKLNFFLNFCHYQLLHHPAVYSMTPIYVNRSVAMHFPIENRYCHSFLSHSINKCHSHTAPAISLNISSMFYARKCETKHSILFLSSAQIYVRNKYKTYLIPWSICC